MIGRVSTHVLDTGLGAPAANIAVTLERIAADGGATLVGRETTDLDGRVGRLNPSPVEPGEYRLVFFTTEYFSVTHDVMFYPRITVQVVLDDREHYHLPVLAGTYSYSTYLGS